MDCGLNDSVRRSQPYQNAHQSWAKADAISTIRTGARVDGNALIPVRRRHGCDRPATDAAPARETAAAVDERASQAAAPRELCKFNLACGHAHSWICDSISANVWIRFSIGRFAQRAPSDKSDRHSDRIRAIRRPACSGVNAYVSVACASQGIEQSEPTGNYRDSAGRSRCLFTRDPCCAYRHWAGHSCDARDARA